MPTYEYRCKDCGQELEVVQSFTDDALTTCETCGGALRKVFGSVGIAFKGSGFYKNDSRGKSSSTTSGSSDANGSSTSEKSGSGNGSGGSSGESSSTTKDSGSTTKKKDAPASSSTSS